MVCIQHAGFDVDLEVKVDTATLYRVYLGRAELGPRCAHAADDERPEDAPASRQADERRRAASRLAKPERVRVEQPPGVSVPPQRRD